MKSATQADRFLRNAASDDRLLPSHISLFMAMLYYSTGRAGDYFPISRKQLMPLSHIRSIATYHKCVRELAAYGYVDYKPSYDPYKGSRVALLKY